MKRVSFTSALVYLVRALMSAAAWASGQSGFRYGTRAWLVRARIGVLLGIVLRSASVPQLESSHSKPINSDNEHPHLLQMTTFEAESICASTDGTISSSDAVNRIWGPLTQQNPAGDWHGIGGGRVAFSADTRPCYQIGGAAIQFFVDIDGTGDPDFPNEVQLPPPATFNGITDHKEYRVAWVYLRTADLQNNGFYRHIVNHETGHVLGLYDGGPTATVPGPDPCQSSIMHPDYYGCNGMGGWPDNGRPEWPSDSDRNSVLFMIPSGFGGGGGGAKGFGF